ncbi:MarR family winged helix-turn-helix transcriptional regulator [Streptomyces sp. NPDC057654]|uniref:MarR family winged helix-turn-helix transcriptional regulator n=1 Tax=Streptomyces sp. NPDC057654 TaxID=3346196 RepID=UPI0036CEF58C
MTQPASPVSPATTIAPADPDATDEALASQPIGYWSGVTHQAVIKHIRDAMARQGVTQPQWWILNQVDSDPAGKTREELADRLASFADGPYEISRSVDLLLSQEWLAAGEDSRFRLTDAGSAAKARIKQLATDLRAEMHDGITDEEYVAALKVLRHMIRNTGGVDALR